MRTWTDYKRHVKSIDMGSKRNMEEIEALTEIVSSVIKKKDRNGNQPARTCRRMQYPAIFRRPHRILQNDSQVGHVNETDASVGAEVASGSDCLKF